MSPPESIPDYLNLGIASGPIFASTLEIQNPTSQPSSQCPVISIPLTSLLEATEFDMGGMVSEDPHQLQTNFENGSNFTERSQQEDLATTFATAADILHGDLLSTQLKSLAEVTKYNEAATEEEICENNEGMVGRLSSLIKVHENKPSYLTKVNINAHTPSLSNLTPSPLPTHDLDARSSASPGPAHVQMHSSQTSNSSCSGLDPFSSSPHYSSSPRYLSQISAPPTSSFPYAVFPSSSAPSSHPADGSGCNSPSNIAYPRKSSPETDFGLRDSPGLSSSAPIPSSSFPASSPVHVHEVPSPAHVLGVYATCDNEIRKHVSQESENELSQLSVIPLPSSRSASQDAVPVKNEEFFVSPTSSNPLFLSPVVGGAKRPLDDTQADDPHAQSRQQSTVPSPKRIKREEMEVQTTRSPKPSTSVSKPPTPKKLSVASQKLRLKKLSTPFRSPLLSKPIARGCGNLDTTATPSTPVTETSARDSTNSSSKPELKQISRLRPAVLPSTSSITTPVKKSYTSKAAAQFKSPLAQPLSPSSSAKPAPSVQVLERKVQMLRRANKIKQDGEKEKLEGLVKKWRDVGREVAWVLWESVREAGTTDGDAGWGGEPEKEKGVGFGSSWGWDGESEKCSGEGSQSNWGWDGVESSGRSEIENGEDTEPLTPPSPTKLTDDLYRSLRKKPAVRRQTMLPPTPRGAYFEQSARYDDVDHRYMEPIKAGGEEDLTDETEEEKKEYTLGTMLRQCGIAPETLGWDEEEGDFVDKD